MDKKLAKLLYHHWDHQAGVYMLKVYATANQPGIRRHWLAAAMAANDKANEYYHWSIVGY